MSDDKDNPPVKVIFRTWTRKDFKGDVIALFPELPGDMDAWTTCMSYVHVGQHGAASVRIIYGVTRPATPQEYNPLLRELIDMVGYNLRIGKRVTRADYIKRLDSVRPPKRIFAYK